MKVPRDLGHRALCVPVRRARHAALLGRAAMAGAAACAGTAAWWQAGPLGLGVLAGAGSVAAAVARGRRRPVPGVRAIRAVAGSRRWQVRLGRRWQPATLCDSRRGACWLQLRLQADRAAGQPVTNCRVAIWRPSVSPDRWRRLCLLAGAAQRLDTPVPRAP